jgi:transcriptional regulator with XRE-family HTH domain
VNTDRTTGLNAAVAAEIRAERAAHQIDIEDLAKMIGVGRSKMINILKPSIDIDIPDLVALGRVFGVSAAALVARAEERMEKENY